MDVQTSLIILLLTLGLVSADTSNDERKPEWEADWNSMAQDILKKALNLKQNTNVAKNVILFLGDGMGIPTVTAGRIYSGQLQGKTGEEYQLTMEKFPHVALSKTYNVNHQVPDSAGTATAYLCGVKTNYGVIGVNQKVVEGLCQGMSPENHVDSVLRQSKREGKRVGVVTTTRITHATPSASYAHCADRDWESDADIIEEAKSIPNCNRDIAYQLIRNNSDINVILGGGRLRFLPNTTTDPEYSNQKGKRQDGLNLIEEWQQIMKSRNEKSVYAWNKTTFDNADTETTDYLLGFGLMWLTTVTGLFEPNHMKYELDRTADKGTAQEPSLVEMTEKAIRILNRGDKGFFLLVEGGRIDHAHHASYGKHALHELKTFDEAVARALTLTDEKETLIIVTADHSHVFTMGGYTSRGNPILGVIDKYAYAIEPPLDNMTYLTLNYANGITGKEGRTNLTGVDTESKEFKQNALVYVNEETHGGEDVAIFARGPMSHLFHGVHEQHYIAHVMAYASCVGINKDHCNNLSTSTATTLSQLNQNGLIMTVLFSIMKFLN